LAYEIAVGPAQLTINAGECVFVTETDGGIRQPSDRGLYYRDTCLISGWAVEVNGRPWQLLSSAATSHFAAQNVLANAALPTDDGELPARSISLTVSRILGDGGMRETLALRNHSRTPVRLSLTIQLRCDFADIFDVKSGRIGL
jgi:glycogen debranching enzyme